MVVLRGTIKDQLKDFGEDSIDIISKSAVIFGYTVEKSGEEIKIEFNPDRIDLCSMDSLMATLRTFWNHGREKDNLKFSGKSMITVDREAAMLRPFTGIIVAEGKEIGSGLDRIISYQEKIHDTVGKDRVQVSIGIHDLEKITLPLRMVSRETLQTTITTYDGIESSLHDVFKNHDKGKQYAHLIPSRTLAPVILDNSDDIMSAPPVINGVKSKVEATTRKFIVDFTGPGIVQVKGAIFLMARAFQSMGYAVTVYPIKGPKGAVSVEQYHNRKIVVRETSVKKGIGIAINLKEIRMCLEKMGYSAREVPDGMEVLVPGYRVDVMGEIDVIEDIMKAYGIDNVPEVTLHIPRSGMQDQFRDFQQLCRVVMAGAGFLEVMSFVVTSERFLAGMKYTGDVTVLNPKSLDNSVVRDRIYPNMLEMLRINKRRSLPQSIFEIGDIITGGKQECHMCVVIEDSRADLSSIKRMMDYFLSRIVGSGGLIVESKVDGTIPGRGGTIRCMEKEIGVIGEIHPEFLERFELQNPVSMMELNLDAIHSIAGT
ncbi:MAG: phenylalanine--tRNA ligase subunit beta [Thermoplasmataceae archaeon]